MAFGLMWQRLVSREGAGCCHTHRLRCIQSNPHVCISIMKVEAIKLLQHQFRSLLLRVGSTLVVFISDVGKVLIRDTKSLSAQTGDPSANPCVPVRRICVQQWAGEEPALMKRPQRLQLNRGRSV